MKKRLLLSLLFFLTGNAFGASDWVPDEWDGPLEPGALGIGLRAGPVSSRWYDREEKLISINNQDCASKGCDTIKGNLKPKFSDMFGGVALWLSGEISYNATDSFNVFGEIAWRRAFGQAENKTQSDEFPKTAIEEFQIKERFDNFDSVGVYIGTRYFIGVWFDCLEPYIGFKVGFMNHGTICQELFIVDKQGEQQTSSATSNECTNTNFPREAYFSNYVVSGGPILGFFYGLSECFFFHMSVEIIASGGMNGNRQIPFMLPPMPPAVPDDQTHANQTSVDNQQKIASKTNNNVGVTNISLGSIPTDFAVPVTFGLVFHY